VKPRLASSPSRWRSPRDSPAQTPAARFDSTRLDSVVQYLRSQVDSAFPGAVVAVGDHNRIALLVAVGALRPRDPRPMTTETVFDVASLTKVIGLTTACILLVDQKKLDLDAPVQRYLPEFRGAGKRRSRSASPDAFVGSARVATAIPRDRDPRGRARTRGHDATRHRSRRALPVLDLGPSC